MAEEELTNALTICTPITIRVTLKRCMYVGHNKWKCCINGETRLVTSQDIQYFALDMNEAANSFRKSEVDKVIITYENYS
jgi:hypothetical protein